MACAHCRNREPGAIIRVHSSRKGEYEFCCLYCGDTISSNLVAAKLNVSDRWDNYFNAVCNAIASKSACLSRQIGAIVVRDKSIVSTGYNGPPRNYPHCTPVDGKCPRHAKGYASGEGLSECPATHAEANAIANAAKLGVSVDGAELYLNTIIPCKDCMALIVNAGIIRVICDELVPYHTMSLRIAKEGNVLIRKFNLRST